jgi:mono/diheme cytochrome c family protein
MKRILLFLGIAAFVGILLASLTTVRAAEYDKGMKLYNDKCRFCHGIKGEGNGPAADSLSTRPTDFTNPKFWNNDVDKTITDTVTKGKGIMPSFDLKLDEIKEIINYMSHVFKK